MSNLATGHADLPCCPGMGMCVGNDEPTASSSLKTSQGRHRQVMRTRSTDTRTLHAPAGPAPQPALCHVRHMRPQPPIRCMGPIPPRQRC